MSELITMDKRDLIKTFRDYQKEWLYSHHDFELSPMLEEVIAKFLDDTAERFMVEKSQLLEEGTTKDATYDSISRQEAIRLAEQGQIQGFEWQFKKLCELPSTEPEAIRCKDCKHFHYDKPYVVYDIPVLGHDVCDKWGDGCKTSENGFCFMAERRGEEE